jgi:nucleoid-associated protein YgaU
MAVSTTALSNQLGNKYVVKEGDTVFKIAEEKLKDTGRWRDIIQWNSDLLQDARDLRPGMEIVLPGTAAIPTKIR